MTTITRLLVANRGEIASRIFATCRRLGIETVAVHSDADAGLPFVAEADAAVRLPFETGAGRPPQGPPFETGAGRPPQGPPRNAPAETYLRADLVLEAARRAGADAIHPGYGFLSENADFARAVTDAGLVWLGPQPEAIEAMGSKIRAKEIMRDAGVPVLEAPEEPTEADLPLLVKASAGGGGRGMRVVRRLADLEGEVARAREEAASAFGDGTVFVEPYVEQGRHVEVQVVGGVDGVLVLGDRDCSVQRRHQKVVEEAPAPGLSDPVRKALHEAARSAAEAIDYRSAGTVEFLFDPATERFFFLEMNTRLQVEHPVTEAVFGVDLVALQIAVAEGRRLESSAHVAAGATTSALDFASPRGHAVEVRLYAEDPAADYQPQSGRLLTFEIPDVDARFEPPATHGIRLDAGFATGSEVGTFYDAMLAKVVAWAPTRAEALRRLAGVLSRARIHGLVTNRDLLVAILRHPDFVAAKLGTDFLPASGLLEPGAGADLRLPATAAALAVAADAAGRRTVQRGIPAGWRNVTSQPQRTMLEPEAGAEPLEIGWYGGRDGFALASADSPDVVEAGPGRVVLAWDGVATAYAIRIERRPDASAARVHVDGPEGYAGFRVVPRFVDPAEALASGSLLAPMPGTVVRVAVEQGTAVAAGDPVVVLEAMKMQHTVAAPIAGTVTELPVVPGEQVAAGQVLAVVDEDPTAGGDAG